MRSQFRFIQASLNIIRREVQKSSIIVTIVADIDLELRVVKFLPCHLFFLFLYILGLGGLLSEAFLHMRLSANFL